MTRKWGGFRTRRRWVLAGVVLAVLAAVFAAGFPVYVRPQVDPLRPADAILVLGGEGVERYALGLELGRRGYASTVLFSNPYGEDTDIDEVREPCRTPQTGFTLECFAPNPPTTLGEGRELRRLAGERGWKTVIVVTMRPHLSRARFILHRCFSGDLIMRPTEQEIQPWYWAWSYVYQTAGYGRALIDRC
ncbi:YdcF family protein [Nocardia sp. CDC153]|uniref:YdcF family protein n=1 Tax=Nocardia sp. CDC153 TaxID=3112167 RepID=UPI002DB72706|nr:YdcF family protein [Nocardia sp. CDC153]MEC3955856.1 YdcF family protein [Nocardia sp. CDC153]